MDLADSGSFEDSASTVDLNKGGSSSRSNRHRSNPSLELLDDFEIESELGRGGMGEVYLATERGLNRQVALKVLPAASRISSSQVKRFLLEAKAAAQLEHDHIVPIYHVGECKGVHYFTMRYIEGCDLSQIIRSGQRAMHEFSSGSVDTQSPSDDKLKSKSAKSSDSTAKDRADSTHGLIDLSRNSFVGSLRSSGTRSAYKLAVSVALIGQAVAEALQHAHENGIVHRDIKPSNLMLDSSNKVWVTDFGLAQLQDAPGQTKTGEILGTLRYMSPEQASARPAFVDHRTDIYSLGVTLYELATLQKACRGESAQEILRSITFERPQPIRKLNPKLPRDLETIICKATERNPSDRYQTAAEMAADLRRFANSESLMARRPSRLKGIRNWIWDRPGVSAMALGMLIVFAVSAFAVAVANQGKFVAEQLRAEEAANALTVSQGQQLLGQSLLLNKINPGLAIAAAVDGAKAALGPAGSRALMAAIDNNHELRTVLVELDYPGKCSCASDGRLAVLCDNVSAYDKIEKRKKGAVVVDLKLGRSIGTLDDESPITEAVFFDGDRFLLTNSVSSDGTGRLIPFEEIKFGKIKIWNPSSLTVVKEFNAGATLRISAENFSRITEQLVLPNNENSATLYGGRDFAPTMVLPVKHTKPVLTCLFSPDASRIATCSLDETVIVWDAKSGEALRTINHPSKRPTSTKLGFTADSKQLIISGEAGARFINLADPTTTEVVRDEQLLHSSSKSNIVYLSDRTRVSIKVFNADSHSVRCICKTDYSVGRSAFFSDDQHLAVVQNEDIAIYNTINGSKVAELRGHQDRVESISSIPGKQELISVSWDGTLRQWNVKSDLQRRTLPIALEAKGPALVLPEPNGKQAVLANVRMTESSVRSIKDPGKPIGRLKADSILVAADGSVLTATRDGATIWAPSTQRKLSSIPLDSKRLAAIEHAIEVPSLQKFVMLSPNGDLYFWDVATNRLSSYVIEGEKVISIALGVSGTELYIGSSGGEIYSLDMTTFARHLLMNLNVLPQAMEVHPERGLLLVTGNNQTAYLIDVSKREITHALTRPKEALSVAKFVAGNRVVTHAGAATKSVSLWDATTGELVIDHATTDLVDVVLSRDLTAMGIATRKEAVYWDLTQNEKTTIPSMPCGAIALVGDKLVMALEGTSSTNTSETSAFAANQLVIWDTGQKVVTQSQTIRQHVRKILPTNEAENFIVVGYEYGAELFDLESIRSVISLTGHLEPILSMNFGADANSLVCVSGDGSVLEHSLTTGQHSLVGQHDHSVTAVAVSSDGRLMLTADTTPCLRIWDLRAKKLQREFETGGQAVSRILMDSPGTFAVLQMKNDLIRQLDLRTNLETDFTVEQGVRDLALSPDGQMLLVATGHREVYPASPIYSEERKDNSASPELLVYRLGKKSQEVIRLEGFPTRCLFVDAGAKFAVLTTLGLVQLFDSKSGQLTHTIKGQRRFMQVIDGLGDPGTVYTLSKNLIEGWSTSEGKLQTQLDIQLSEFDAAFRFPVMQRSSSSSAQLFLNDRALCVYPKDYLEYGEKVAPRKIEGRERTMLLNSFGLD